MDERKFALKRNIFLCFKVEFDEAFVTCLTNLNQSLYRTVQKSYFLDH